MSICSDIDDFHNKHHWISLKSQGDTGQYSNRFFVSDDFRITYPKLYEFLICARVTPVIVDDKISANLLGWTDKDGASLGWLCPFHENVNKPFIQEHKLLLSGLGGIHETRRDEKHEDNWLDNLNWALTARECNVGFPYGPNGWESGWRDYYIDECEISEVTPSIDPNEYIVFAEEANGNRMLYHIKTGEVIAFMADTARDDITPYHQDSKETFYTLLFYHINDCPNFVTWVETVAEQWLSLL